jgi:arginyl-tRNA synthetase
MPKIHDSFRKEIIDALESELNLLCTTAGISNPFGRNEIFGLLSTPPTFELGQAALPCFPFAKILKSAPVKIAETLAQKILTSTRQTIANVTAVNGYLNFHVDFNAFGRTVCNEMGAGNYFTKELLNESELEKVVVEYSQPNTHKAMHVGHLRGLVLGDAVCNLLDYVGSKAVRTTYPGDLGTHVAKELWYIKYRYKGELPTSDQANWLGKVYAEADESLKREIGTDKEAENRTQMSGILKSLQNKEGEFYDLYLKTREWSLNEMQRIYNWLGVTFERWYFESECDEPSRQLVLQKFKEGIFVKSDGAIGIDLAPFKLGFAMFLKSDGNGLYSTKDIELMRRKFEDPTVTSSIVVVDSRQKLHFQQIFKTGEIMGYPQAAKSVHLSYETVNTSDGKAFSSRHLNGLKLEELRVLMEEKVTKDYLERYRGQWTDEEIARTACEVVIGALKYGMLRVDSNTQITFVLEEWLKLDGDTGPYMQYVHARCMNILEKQGQPEQLSDFELENDYEKELVFSLSRFNEFTLVASQGLRPSVIANYLFDLCKAFNRFYEHCPVRSATGPLRNSRLLIVQATGNTLRKGLALLGIPAPHRM